MSSVSAAERRFSFVLSPAAFRRVARVAVGTLVLIVASGATVRSTGSGLGCPSVTFNLSSCEKAYGSGYHADIEFFNRGASGLVVVVVLGLALAAWRTAGLDRRTKLLALAAFLATVAQIPLGAITVHYDLNPYLVVAHFLLALVALALGVLTLVEADRAIDDRGGEPLPQLARLGGAVLLAAVTVLVVSGTFSTAAGRFPGSSGNTVVPRLWAFHAAVYWHVRAVAVFGVVFLALAVWAWQRRVRFPWLLRGCAGLLALLLAQMAMGELQYRTYGTVPWGVVVVHVALAAALFGWTVGLVARLWRPVAAQNAN